MASHNGFDPSKAQIGVWSRTAYNGPVRRPEELGQEPSWEMDPEDYEFEEKLAAIESDVELPNFPEPRPGGDFEESAPLRKTDLAVHGSHEAPKPTAKQLISERIRNLKAQVVGGEKKIVQKQQEEQDARFDENQARDSDISINRRDYEPHGGWQKTSSSMLSLLEQEDANPIKVMLVLDNQWGNEWREWEPETIQQTADHEGVTIARTNWDKIMALKVLSRRDDFWEDARVFEKVCLAFSNRMVDWGHVQQPRLHEIAACVALVERYIKERDFTDEVQVYVAAAAVRDGYVLLPPVLSFAGFPFSQELAMNVGDDIVEVQERLMQALEQEDKSILESDQAVQYMRLLRCQYHTQETIDQARS